MLDYIQGAYFKEIPFGNSSQKTAVMEAHQNHMEQLKEIILMYMQAVHHEDLPEVCAFVYEQLLPMFCFVQAQMIPNSLYMYSFRISS